jgi:hypothetical protein
LMAFGGHIFEMIEASEIVEVKQGTYSGEADKGLFSGITVIKMEIGVAVE